MLQYDAIVLEKQNPQPAVCIVNDRDQEPNLLKSDNFIYYFLNLKYHMYKISENLIKPLKYYNNCYWGQNINNNNYY